MSTLVRPGTTLEENRELCVMASLTFTKCTHRLANFHTSGQSSATIVHQLDATWQVHRRREVRDLACVVSVLAAERGECGPHGMLHVVVVGSEVVGSEVHAWLDPRWVGGWLVAQSLARSWWVVLLCMRASDRYLFVSLCVCVCVQGTVGHLNQAPRARALSLSLSLRTAYCVLKISSFVGAFLLCRLFSLCN